MIRYFFISLLVSAASIHASSQQLSQVLFQNAERQSAYSFTTDQHVIIRVSDDGQLLKWGMEADNRRYNYYPGQLEEFMGRVDYYGNEGDSVSKGKVKNIGTCMISYYGPFEAPYKKGKIRSLGAVQFDYYNEFDNVAYRGKIRSANNSVFTYYSSFDNEMLSGKLKTVNNTPIIFYSSFDDKSVRGKVKSIGSFTYSWYSSFDRREFQGAMKQGMPAQYINGITYIVNSY